MQMRCKLPFCIDGSNKVFKLLKSIPQLQRNSIFALYTYYITNQGHNSVLKGLTGTRQGYAHLLLELMVSMKFC
jgi:hypothetical protein